MLDKINYRSLVTSFGIGVAISCSFQLQLTESIEVKSFLMVAFAGGGIGFLIGAIAEIITAFLPVSLAKPKTYFLISGGIGLGLTIIVLMLSKLMLKESMDVDMFRTIVLIAVSIVAVANVLDFKHYKKANNHLEAYKRELAK